MWYARHLREKSGNQVSSKGVAAGPAGLELLALAPP
jgi:hypothetical protein